MKKPHHYEIHYLDWPKCELYKVTKTGLNLVHEGHYGWGIIVEKEITDVLESCDLVEVRGSVGYYRSK